MIARYVWTGLALILAATAACSDNKGQPADGGTADASGDATPEASTVDATPDGAGAVSLFAAGATEGPVNAAVPGFAAQNGLAVSYTFGSAGSLRDQILTGDSGADVAIVTPAVITALSAQSLVYPGSRIDLGQVAGAVAVRSSDPAPDVSTSDTFRSALLAADEIWYADPTLATAGAQFVNICATLGISSTCAVAPAGKGHIAPTGSVVLADMVASTATTVIAAAQASEIIAAPGVKLVGDFPSAPIDLSIETVYSAIIVQGTENLPGAQLLLQYLGGPAFQSVLGTYGFTPISDP